MIGDILFYRSKPNDLPDELISLYEKLHGANNPFVHVAIEYTPGPSNSTPMKVEALWNGVTLSALNNSNVAARYSLPKTLNPTSVFSAFNWLDGMVWQPYGYGDLLDVLLQHPVLEAHYDCSALAVDFLRMCGDPHIKLGDNPHIITPQQLSLMLGVK